MTATSSFLSPGNSVAFGMRKALMAEQGKADMEQQIRDLEEERRYLEHQVCVCACVRAWVWLVCGCVCVGVAIALLLPSTGDGAEEQVRCGGEA